MNVAKLTFILLFTLTTLAFAHETRTLEADDGTQYDVTVGLLNEPIYNTLRTGIDLIIRTTADEAPVENLESSLQADITAPDGSSTRTLTLRPQYNKPGYYTSDLMLGEPGTYDVRVYGFIGEMALDETSPTQLAAIYATRFP